MTPPAPVPGGAGPATAAGPLPATPGPPPGGEHRRRGAPVRAALAGVLAAAAGLAVGELLAGLLKLRRAPVAAVGAAFIDLVPGWLKELAIRLFGTADKTALVAGILVVLTALAALAGILGARWRPVGLALVLGFAALGAVASVTRPDAGGVDVVPSVGAGLVGAAVLSSLLRRFGVAPVAATGGTAHPPRDAQVHRRAVLKSGGAVAVASLAAAGLGRAAGGRRTGVEHRRAALHVPRPPSLAVPAGADLRIDDLTPWRTMADSFYRVDTALTVPLVDPDGWRLRLHGMVDREVTVGLRQLLRRRVVHRWVTLTCVSNFVGGDLAGNALWSGVRVADLLREAGVHADADAVRSTSADGWTAGTPLSALTDGRDALLAFAMNGQPLPVEHGFPVRMVVPGLYGYVSATKWITEIEVTRFDRFRAYWTDRGWAEQAPIKTASRIDVPRTGARVLPGRTVVAGVAWAQHRGIDRVEVRVDNGPWHRARLGAEPTADSWRQWAWTWQADSGTHRLQVRAVDGTGAVQTSASAPPAPDGATGWHTVEVSVG